MLKICKREVASSAMRALVSLFMLIGVVSCKTTAERTKEQSETQNVLTNYVKTPQDRAKGMKAKLEAQQNQTAEQGRALSEGE